MTTFYATNDRYHSQTRSLPDICFAAKIKAFDNHQDMADYLVEGLYAAAEADGELKALLSATIRPGKFYGGHWRSSRVAPGNHNFDDEWFAPFDSWDELTVEPSDKFPHLFLLTPKAPIYIMTEVEMPDREVGVEFAEEHLP